MKGIRDIQQQSIEHRLYRLSKQRCPIHEKWIGQESVWIVDETGIFALASCGIDDCYVLLKAYSSDQDIDRVELLPETGFLLIPGGDTPQSIEHAQKAAIRYRKAALDREELEKLIETARPWKPRMQAESVPPETDLSG